MSQRNSCTKTRSTSRNISLDTKASHSTSNNIIDTTTLKKYVQMVKDAPSINEEKIALIKKRIEERTYLNSAIINEMVSEISARI